MLKDKLLLIVTSKLLIVTQASFQPKRNVRVKWLRKQISSRLKLMQNLAQHKRKKSKRVFLLL